MVDMSKDGTPVEIQLMYLDLTMPLTYMATLWDYNWCYTLHIIAIYNIYNNEFLDCKIDAFGVASGITHSATWESEYCFELGDKWEGNLAISTEWSTEQ